MIESKNPLCLVLSFALAACAEGSQIQVGAGGGTPDGGRSDGTGAVGGGGVIGGGAVVGGANVIGGGGVIGGANVMGGGPVGGAGDGGAGAGTTVVSTAFPPGNSEWVGAYTCEQGLTNLQLTMTRDAATNAMTGLFAFSAHPSNPGVESGSFSLIGDYDPSLDELLLSPEAWVDQPGVGWTMLGVSGIYDETLNSIQLTLLDEGQPLVVCQPVLVTPMP